MAPFTKPEAVIKQAEGLISVGQSPAALQSLVEMFSSKRFRSTPLATLEPIVIRFVELCVDMRKGRTAKEGLMQYKNIAQNTSVGSIEVVINRFIQLADAKVQEAQEKADKVTGPVDIDDLEASETPESILLGAVSGDQSKDRTDRALVTPWLKFLWESYRTSLETLKNNARLEVIYQVGLVYPRLPACTFRIHLWEFSLRANFLVFIRLLKGGCRFWPVQAPHTLYLASGIMQFHTFFF